MGESVFFGSSETCLERGLMKCPKCKVVLKQDHAIPRMRVDGLSPFEKEAIREYPTLLLKCPKCYHYYIWFPQNLRWYEFYDHVWHYVLTERAVWSVS